MTVNHQIIFKARPEGWVTPDCFDMRDVPLPGRRALTDLDTPEAWQAWEAAQAAE